MGFLFEGSKQETRTDLPNYIKDFSREAMDRARGIADKPYEGYNRQRVANANDAQVMANQQAKSQFGVPLGMVQAGFDRTQQLSNKSMQDSPVAREGLRWMEEGRDLTTRAGNARWTEQSADRYMNPFLQSALDPVIRRINEESQQNAIGTRAGQIMSGGEGAFGDARTGVLEGEIEESRLRGIGDTMASGYRDAYDRALSEWGNTQNRRLAAGGQLGSLGGMQVGLFGEHQDRQLRGADLMGTQGGRYAATTAQGIQDLLATGGTRYAINQAQRDANYADWLDERNHDQAGLDAYLRTLSATPYGQTTSGNTGQSPFQQGAGLAIAGAGLWSMMGA